MANVSLSPRGVRQSESLARSLSGEPLRYLFSSPLERARETAEIIGRHKNLHVRACDSFIEYDFGTWTGCNYLALAQDTHWKNFNAHRSTVSPPQGETMLAVQARFVGGLFRIAAQYPGENVAVVSHCEPIRSALLYCFGLSLDQWERIEVSVASVSVVTISDDGPRVLRLNDTPKSLSESSAAPWPERGVLAPHAG
jgi:broad specificity phosphatase PhoE